MNPAPISDRARRAAIAGDSYLGPVCSLPEGTSLIPWRVRREFIQRASAGENVSIVQVSSPGNDVPEYTIGVFRDGNVLGEFHPLVHDLHHRRLSWDVCCAQAVKQ